MRARAAHSLCCFSPYRPRPDQSASGHLSRLSLPASADAADAPPTHRTHWLPQSWGRIPRELPPRAQWVPRVPGPAPFQPGAKWTDVRGRDNRHQGPAFLSCQSQKLTWTSSSGFSGLARSWCVTCCRSLAEGPRLPWRSYWCLPPWETESWVGLLRRFIFKNSDETQVGLEI